MRHYLADGAEELAAALESMRQAEHAVQPAHDAAVEVARRAVNQAEAAARAADAQLQTARRELTVLKTARRKICNEAIGAWLDPALLAAQSAVQAADDQRWSAREELRAAEQKWQNVSALFAKLEQARNTVRSLSDTAARLA